MGNSTLKVLSNKYLWDKKKQLLWKNKPKLTFQLSRQNKSSKDRFLRLAPNVKARLKDSSVMKQKFAEKKSSITITRKAMTKVKAVLPY